MMSIRLKISGPPVAATGGPLVSDVLVGSTPGGVGDAVGGGEPDGAVGPTVGGDAIGVGASCPEVPPVEAVGGTEPAEEVGWTPDDGATDVATG